MKRNIYFKRLCYRRLLLLLFRRFRWYTIIHLLLIIVFLFLFISISLLFYYSILIYFLNTCCFSSSNVIVSLTTTPKRFQYELPITIHSLLTQRKLPKEIRIYLSPTSTVINQTNLTLEHLKIYLKKLDSSIIIRRLFNRLVRIRLEEQDYGPATKYLPIIKEYHNISQIQRIIICDDDHYYHPYMISILDEYSNIYQNSIVGFRGWRIRRDLNWGVAGPKEFTYHVIEAFRIIEMYRVGVITANHAYLIRPSFFDSHIYEDFNQASADIRRVDDIWINAYASKRNISRLVVPSCCESITITRTHELENYFKTHHMTRYAANGHALKYFKNSWENNLWYRYHGQNGPKFRDWRITIYREWNMILLRLKCFIYSGSI